MVAAGAGVRTVLSKLDNHVALTLRDEFNFKVQELYIFAVANSVADLRSLSACVCGHQNWRHGAALRRA